MTASMACDPERMTGYRREQLVAAFARVRNARDWKAPIRAVITAAEWPAVQQAVLWFTGTTPISLAAPGDANRLLVSAPGYRLGPAGEPPVVTGRGRWWRRARSRENPRGAGTEGVTIHRRSLSG
jgi:hypothetical protein